MCHVSHISHINKTAFATPCIPSPTKWHHGNTYIYVCRPISTITLNSCCVEGAASLRLPCFCPLAVSLTLEWSLIRPRAALTPQPLLFGDWPQPLPAPHPKHTHKTMSYTALLSSSSAGFPKLSISGSYKIHNWGSIYHMQMALSASRDTRQMHWGGWLVVRLCTFFP